MNSVRVHSLAEDEILEAAGWYRARSELACERFLDEVGDAIADLPRFPRRYPRLTLPGSGPVVRRARLRRFPYALVFTETENYLHVIAVVHTRRRPLYWLARARDDKST